MIKETKTNTFKNRDYSKGSNIIDALSKDLTPKQAWNEAAFDSPKDKKYRFDGEKDYVDYIKKLGKLSGIEAEMGGGGNWDLIVETPKGTLYFGFANDNEFGYDLVNESGEKPLKSGSIDENAPIEKHVEFIKATVEKYGGKK